MTMFREYPAIEFPAALIARGFEDESWHNDAAPRAVRRIRDNLQITVWVDYDAPGEREIPGATKFMVVLESEYGENTILVGNFEDEEAALACVDALLKAVQP